MARKEYRNAIRSKIKIQDAIISLIKEKKDFGKITVTSVIDRAEVNRGTFYNHYKDINEVMSDIEDRIVKNLDNILESLKTYPIEEQVNIFFDKITPFFEDNRDELHYISCFVPMSIFEDLNKRINSTYANYVTKYISKANTDKSRILLSCFIISSGISATYLNYFKGKSEASLQEIAESSSVVVKNLIESHIGR